MDGLLKPKLKIRRDVICNQLMVAYFFAKKMLTIYKNKSIHINYLVFLLKILLKSGIITGGSQK